MPRTSCTGTSNPKTSCSRRLTRSNSYASLTSAWPPALLWHNTLSPNVEPPDMWRRRLPTWRTWASSTTKSVTFSASDAYSTNCNNPSGSRITGKDLFPGTDYYEILKLNKKCFVSLDTLGIYRTPQTGVELISRMLCQNPNERITAAQALEHPFFAGTPFSERKLKFQQQKRKEP